MALEVAFWIMAVLTVLAAVAVIVFRDVFRAALALVLCLFTVAGVYIILSADFLAAVQVLVYVGAISVLIILAIMLTREVQRGSPSNRLRVPAFIVILLLLGTMVVAIMNTSWSVSEVPPQEPTTEALAIRLFSEEGFILAVEIASVLLLAAILGAIVLVRER